MTRCAVVTGAAGGIGQATCAAFLEAGWDVVGLDIRTVDTFDVRVADVSDAAAVGKALAGVARVDALVNNAAVQHFKPLLETTEEEWDAVLAHNLRGPFTCTRVLHPLLAAARGAVVNVASVHAFATSDSVAAYAASKGGLVALTRAAALELAGDGIRVNAVVPGAVDTPALRSGFGRRQDAERSLVERTPLGRIADPHEIAEVILFLADGRRSSFITGQTIVADGGALARLSTE